MHLNRSWKYLAFAAVCFASAASPGRARAEAGPAAAAGTNLLSSRAALKALRAAFHEKTLPNGKKAFEPNPGYAFVRRSDGTIGIVDAKGVAVGDPTAHVTCSGCDACKLSLHQGYATCDGCEKCTATIVIKSGIAGAPIDEVLTTDGKQRLVLRAGASLSKTSAGAIITVTGGTAQKAKQYTVTCSGCPTCAMIVTTVDGGSNIGCSGCPDDGVDMCTIDFKEVKGSDKAK
ncbi:MAG: hypothetical protein U0174_28355 [Polyangiaceae bacterium]